MKEIFKFIVLIPVAVVFFIGDIVKAWGDGAKPIENIEEE